MVVTARVKSMAVINVAKRGTVRKSNNHHINSIGELLPCVTDFAWLQKLSPRDHQPHPL
jgi:hypothetical protein